MIEGFGLPLSFILVGPSERQPDDRRFEASGLRVRASACGVLTEFQMQSVWP